MKTFVVATVLAALLFTTPAFAQTVVQPYDLGPMNQGGFHQGEVLATGRITEIDLSKGTLALDTGMQFTLSPSLQYTSFPALGDDVQVTYSEHDGHNVARIIDVGGTRTQGNGS